MRFIHVAAFAVLFSVSNAELRAQTKPVTDAAQDRLAGRVRSVDTVRTPTETAFPTVLGPDVLIDILCAVCTYDADGSRTFRGEHQQGAVIGTPTRLIRDPAGHVIEREEVDMYGNLISREAVGPFGLTESTSYYDGAIQSRATWSYDEYGHLTEWQIRDGSGKLLGRQEHREDKDSINIDDRYWGQNSELGYTETQNTRTVSDSFSAYDSHGAVTITWSVAGGKLISFWEDPKAVANDDAPIFGEAFYEDLADNTRVSYSCTHQGECTAVRSHTDYLGDDKRLPVNIEVRDADGKLLRGAYYEYQLDSARNWTTRRVFVSSPGVEGRQLFEIDTRTITYYPD